MGISVLDYDLLGHTLADLLVELDRLSSWKADLLGEIVWQKLNEVLIATLVKEWFVGEFGILVREV